jgi:hypothetical protein
VLPPFLTSFISPDALLLSIFMNGNWDKKKGDTLFNGDKLSLFK